MDCGTLNALVEPAGAPPGAALGAPKGLVGGGGDAGIDGAAFIALNCCVSDCGAPALGEVGGRTGPGL